MLREVSETLPLKIRGHIRLVLTRRPAPDQDPTERERKRETERCDTFRTARRRYKHTERQKRVGEKQRSHIFTGVRRVQVLTPASRSPASRLTQTSKTGLCVAKGPCLTVECIAIGLRMTLNAGVANVAGCRSPSLPENRASEKLDTALTASRQAQGRGEAARSEES